MYNGVGLTTVRGTATNGYVQRNKAFQRPKEKVLSFPPVVWRTSRPLIACRFQRTAWPQQGALGRLA
jgi:hypothetical protein